MRIGVDATSWFDDGSCGRFTREILSAMVVGSPNHEYFFYAERRDIDAMDLPARLVRWCPIDLATRPVDAARGGGLSRGDARRLTGAVRHAWKKEWLRTFFYPSLQSYFTPPRAMPTVLCVHDLAAESFTRRLRSSRALRRADVVFTGSEYGSREIAETYDISQRKIRVAQPAPAAAFRPGASESEIADAKRKIGLAQDARYFIHAGAFAPHKNVGTLVRAHALVSKADPEAPHLVLAGNEASDWFPSEASTLKETIRASGNDSRVHWTGHVSDEELRLLYSGAVAQALPSLKETFGMASVEAAACGTPVIATTESPLPELLAGAGRFVAPHDLAGWIDALEELAAPAFDREPLRAAGLEAVKGLDWKLAARRAIVALADVSRKAAFPMLPWVVDD